MTVLKSETNNDGIIQDKKFFSFALALLIITMTLNFPFPHTNPYGEVTTSVFNIPIKTVYGCHYLGILTMLLFWVGIFFFAKSLKDKRGRFTLLAIILTMAIPVSLTSIYQRTLATGIYAISYEDHLSKCNFETINPDTLRGTCELIFENHDNKPVPFEIAFYEEYPFEEEFPMQSLMNHGAPYKVLLMGNEKKAITIETDIPKKKVGFDSGDFSNINIIIQQGEKQRNL